jgi:ABC-type branched-subunit amino acid transport system substrate-binding protein
MMRPIRIWLTAMIVAFGSAAFVAPVALAQDRLQPQRDYHDPASTAHADVAEVGIGLVLLGEAPAGQEWVRGAQLAIDQANAAGGFAGKPFRLLVRYAPPRWASAAEVYRDLIFGADCVGLISPASGEVGHLAAQMASKGHTPLVCLSAERSLTRIPVAWLFRTVPDTRQELRALLKDIAADQDRRLAAVIPDDRNGAPFEQDIQIIAEELGVTIDPIIRVNERPGLGDLPTLVGEGRRVLVFFPTPDAQRRPGDAALSESGIVLVDAGTASSVRLYDPSDAAAREFDAAYEASHHAQSTEAAARGFDAANALVQTIRQAGLDRSAIRQALSEAHFDGMVTHLEAFDEHGNHVGPVSVHTSPRP